MNIRNDIRESIMGALKELDLSAGEIHLEHPTELSHGDHSTNVAMVLAKGVGKNPRELAEEIVAKLPDNDVIESVNVAGPGFVNFTLSPVFFADQIKVSLEENSEYGKNTSLSGKRAMVEFTDPNPFKVFHIGHLMSNAIGESIARLYEFSGADVVCACYQGDVGLHVAKAIWGVLQHRDEFPNDSDDISLKTTFLGEAYVSGSNAYEESPEAKEEIHEINKKVFAQSDDDINEIYDKGREWSLEHFEEIYAKLGTKFEHYFFESEVADPGIKIVKEFLAKGIFKESEGAVIFPGEEYGLHNRVFINSIGLPTYEAKELGLFVEKDKREASIDTSIVITAEEQREYMKVVVKALEQIKPDLAKKFHHITHGMLRFAEGKMSSRKGNIITGESLIAGVEELSRTKMSDRDIDDKETVTTQVAVGAIKYSILKQSPGKDIIYDFEKSLSFEGDSGPYLQYTYARTQSILRKASDKGIQPDAHLPEGWETTDIERWLYRFPEVIEKSLDEYAPHHVVTYLIDLARAFNSFYGNTQIVVGDDNTSPYKVALSSAVGIVLKNGLWVLGIEAPEKM